MIVFPRWLQLLLMAWQSSRRSTQPFPARARRDTLHPSSPPGPSAPPATAMRLVPTEYLLKGVYLGLVLFAALHLATIPPVDQGPVLVQQGLAWVNLSTLAGLALALFLAGLLRFREALLSRGRVLAFFLFLLLESPTLTYLGILGGTFTGIFLLRQALSGLEVDRLIALQQLLLPVIGGSALAGLAFGLLRQVRDRTSRLLLILLLTAGLVAAGMSWLGVMDFKFLGIVRTYQLENPTAFALQLLCGIPFFYLLTFAGQEEESEVEIGVMMGMLGLGLGILGSENKQMGSLAFLLPVVLYFGYTLRVLPGLRVLKHAFRGLSYARVGKHRRALTSFRRALQLDPTNRLAREGFWEVHQMLDLDRLVKDPQTLALVDLDLCLDRAGSLLLKKPTPAQLAEAQRLLELVVTLDPRRKPAICYWLAVAHTHAGRLDLAASELERLLDPAHFGEDHPFRLQVLLQAWQLALHLHPRLREQVGLPQLAQPGRRMEAIAALERHRTANPEEEQSLTELRHELYRDLTEQEYNSAVPDETIAAPHVDHHYLQQLGLSLIHDDTHWTRGGEYLRLAARGLPHLGPSLFLHIAQAQQRCGLLEQARHNYELAKRAGQGIGPKNLEEAQRQAYFAAVKVLAEASLAQDDVDGAIENLRLYSESERSGIETLRTLASLYERRGDALAAARAVDQALQYNSKDEDLLQRKDRYYYSISPEDLKRRLEQYGPGFDLAYCLQKSRLILDKYPDAEWLDVAHHLCQLALVVQPESLVARLLLARVQLRLGARDEAVTLLEEVRGPQKPDRFASAEEEEAWFQASQLLGDLYLEMGRADLAVPCLNDFRKSSKSGAKTLFKLGQAYEAIGDRARAKRCYEQVTAYQGNPLAPEAEDALARLQS